jgi:hypothetical protein
VSVAGLRPGFGRGGMVHCFVVKPPATGEEAGGDIAPGDIMLLHGLMAIDGPDEMETGFGVEAVEEPDGEAMSGRNQTAAFSGLSMSSLE